MPFYESHERQLSITPDCRKTLVIFQYDKRLASKAVLRCMGGDLTLIVMHGYDRESPRLYVAPPPSHRPWRLSPLVVQMKQY